MYFRVLMDEFEYYKELYFKENERREAVVNSLNIPIAIITGLSSGTYFLITCFDYNIDRFLTLVFLFLIIPTTFFIL